MQFIANKISDLVQVLASINASLKTIAQSLAEIRDMIQDGY